MILVLCPTRGRPREAVEMWRSLVDTAELPTTQLVLVIDHDDPTMAEYKAAIAAATHRYGWDTDLPFIVGLAPEHTGNLVRATNSAAAKFWDRDIIIGHVGDDHRFRTPGWDRKVTHALAEPGIAYGDDGYWGDKVATSVFMSAVIPRTLGWYALPACQHNGWDNATVDLGHHAGVLHYLPDVLIEHPHPDLRRNSDDPGYRRARELQEADRRAYLRWRSRGLPKDADLLLTIAA